MLESELFALLERTPDATFVVSDDGKIQFWSKAAQHLFGYSPEEVQHKSCFQVLHGMGSLGTRVCHEGCSVMQCAEKETEVPNFDMSVKTKGGRRLWINMSTLVFENPRNGRRLLIHLAHDVSEQKKTEQLLQKTLDVSQQLKQLPVRPSPASPLSEQEKLVLRLFAEGKSSLEVESSLNISVQTLRNHVHHINQKLRTRNRLEAVMNAIQRKLI